MAIASHFLKIANPICIQCRKSNQSRLVRYCEEDRISDKKVVKEVGSGVNDNRKKLEIVYNNL